MAFVLYVAVATLLLCRHGIGWRAAARLSHGGRDVRADVAAILGDDASTRRRVRESPDVVAPVTAGVVSPTILLPLTWRTWPRDKTRAALAHELAHVRRHDALVAHVAHLNRSLFWFHPLAWWLERAIADYAEQACDADAVRLFEDRRRYAAILVEMAQAVRDHGGRLSWYAAGIGGPRRLGRRIDRVLRADLAREPSVVHRTGIAASCAIAIAVAAACRPETAAPRFTTTDAIEQRDRALRVVLHDLQVRNYRDFEFVDGTEARQRIPSLEAAVASHPDDLASVKALLLGYWIEPDVVKRRALILGVIERHPESELAGSVLASIVPADLASGTSRADDPTFPGDSAGYEQAKALWLAQVNQANASETALGNAAYFFEPTDKPLTESLLRRARTRNPHGPWAARLGHFYARALGGIRAPVPRGGLRIVAAADPRSPYGVGIREMLGQSTDDELLATTGFFLAYVWRDPWMEFDSKLWAESCLKRALQLNPRAVLAHTELLRLAAEREFYFSEPLWRVPPVMEYQVTRALPEQERFERLPRLVRAAYSTIVDLARWQDPNLRERIDLAAENARRFAMDALALAPKYRQHPRYGTAIYVANMTLGALALRDGRTADAVKFLRQASEAPASEELAYADDVVPDGDWARWHLASDLLARGEREAVRSFLTRMAAVNIPRRSELLEAAAAITRGETPKI